MSKSSYAGIPEEFSTLENAKIVLIPISYDGTSTWQKGSDKGPEAFLNASENMELYDIETDTEVYKEGIYLNETLGDFKNPEEMVFKVYEITKRYLKTKKFVTLFGGEHSVSIGSLRAFSEAFDDLTVLHIDAHADLRPSYENSPYNHACAVYEASKNTNLIQVGIRSMDSSEKKFMDEEKTFFAHEIAQDSAWMDTAIDLMTDKVFLTLDLDAFDPSILPSTGTPEPGGLLWYETLEFLKEVFAEKDVVGFDIVELCPNEKEKSSDFLAAKLYYKMLSYKFLKERFDLDDENNYNNNLGNTKKQFEDDEF